MRAATTDMPTGTTTTLGNCLAFLDAGLSLERVVELPGGGVILPRNVAIVASKTQNSDIRPRERLTFARRQMMQNRDE